MLLVFHTAFLHRRMLSVVFSCFYYTTFCSVCTGFLEVAYCNLQKATALLKATLDANGVVYENKDAGLSLLTMIYWKTWIGCEAEIAAIHFLKRMYIECTIADREIDRKYAVDILIHKGSEIVAGIQVKPISYLRTQQRFNPEKNDRFKKDYDCDVLYMFYNFSEKKFRKEDVRTIREYMKTIYNGKRCA